MTNVNDNVNETKKAAWSKLDWLLLGTNVLLLVIMYLVFNNQLPDEVASHYNVHGEADRTMVKWSFWLMYAGVGIALPSFLSAMRYIDPRKKNYSRFEDYYNLMRWTISLFLHAVFLLLILDNLGHNLPTLKLVIGALGILWIIIGNRMGQVRSNFFIGIRTPWALMSESNWRSTHRLGGRLWVLAGVIMFASVWFVPSTWATGILLACTISSSIVPTLYSYVLYRRAKA
ncbi:SdpI family protein [Cohnella sp. WQ 127256]|uniref:SdpI family protein n=1 Tax=Cohnella sp. WQ 127256 TaxID=2938790 RepID=UPI0021176D4B|nr:SdpI family protein [Cohnella sp. WQ 127256]